MFGRNRGESGAGDGLDFHGDGDIAGFDPNCRRMAVIDAIEAVGGLGDGFVDEASVEAEEVGSDGTGAVGTNLLANNLWWCESCTVMSATIVRAKRQTTLPEDVCQAAGIRIRDQVDWRFQDGEIRGRKLVPAPAKAQTARPVKFKDLLILPQDIEVDYGALDRDLRASRNDRDEQLLG
jgi:hypothetical protein